MSVLWPLHSHRQGSHPTAGSGEAEAAPTFQSSLSHHQGPQGETQGEYCCYGSRPQMPTRGTATRKKSHVVNNKRAEFNGRPLQAKPSQFWNVGALLAWEAEEEEHMGNDSGTAELVSCDKSKIVQEKAEKVDIAAGRRTHLRRGRRPGATVSEKTQ